MILVIFLNDFFTILDFMSYSEALDWVCEYFPARGRTAVLNLHMGAHTCVNLSPISFKTKILLI